MWEYPENENAYSDVHSGEYFRHRKITAGDRVLDLGAHVGYFSQLAYEQGATVIAFEPHPDNYAALFENTFCMNVLTVNKAAGAMDRETDLYHCATNSGAHSLFHNHGGDSHRVQEIDIGKWLVQFGFKPDFIKIDTEGAEFAILSSLLRAGIVADCAIEIHSNDLYWNCRELAEGAGLKFLPETPNIGICYIIK